MNEPQNFFKHADQDPGAVLEFRPAVTAFFLLDCVNMDRECTGRNLPEGLVFVARFGMEHPDVLETGPVSEMIAAWSPGWEHGPTRQGQPAPGGRD